MEETNKVKGGNRMRWAITHIGEDGLRKLTLANQGRNHFDTHQEAEARKLSILLNNDVELLEQAYGQKFIQTVEVNQVECYHHGDAIRTIL